MAKPIIHLRKLSARAVIFTLSLSVLTAPVGPRVFAADTSASAIATSEYDVPDYNQTKLPSISSCDPKAQGSSSSDDLPSTGNSYLDAVTSTATKLNKAYGGKTGDADEYDEEEDVDGKATLDTDCEKLKTGGASEKLGYDSEKLQCGQVNAADFIEELRSRKTASNKYLACKRGVLDALRGEIGCFKKQIADAEGYMNELVNGQGGLAQMLNQGNSELTQIDQEVQDRQSQYAAANDRIEGGEGGNPPGLRQAKEAITKLSSSLPVEVTKVNQAVENLRNQQSRFETLVSQLTMGRAMACMKAPAQGYRCLKQGTTSASHPEWNGTVSPLVYLECLYAQSANKLSGGSVVKNASREASLLSSANSAFTQAAAKTPSATDLPDFSDQKSFNASLKTYPVKTPADLTKLLEATLQTMGSATGKNMSAQFTSSLNTCYAQAKKEVAAERTDTNSQIKATETAMKQSFETTRAANAKTFRDLRETYTQTLKAATGQTIPINTERCEKASLEDQAKCFDAMNAMVDSLLTGKVVSSASSLTGPALALTNGANPISKFSASLPAKNMPQRGLAIQCAGIDDCLTQYSNVRTQLKQVVEERKTFKESYKTRINNKLLTTAKDLASKGTTGVGQAGIQTSGITLNSLAAGISARKNQLTTAMSKLGVDAGLDLDPKEIKDPSIDEATGLYKPADLKSLVLSEITPALPDTNSRGFTDTLKGIQDQDKKLGDLQDKLDTDLSAAEAKVAECASSAKKANCDKATAQLKECRENASKDKLSILEADISTLMAKLSSANAVLSGGKNASATAEVAGLNEQLGEKNAQKASLSTSTECGVDRDDFKKYCAFGDSVTDNDDKGNQVTGRNSPFKSYRAAPTQ